MANNPIDRRSAMKAAATGGIALAAGTIAATVPTTSAVAAGPDDAAVAAAVETPDSLTRGALNALYPAYRVWDAAAGTYPARVPGALNIFFGPVPPGVLMDPTMDYWANSEGTTVGEVLSEVQNVTSALHAAVRTAATPATVEFNAADVAAVDNRPPMMGTLSPSSNLSLGVPVLLFGDGTVQVAGRPWRTPVGWNACRVHIDWAHDVAAPSGQVNWQARIADYGPGTDLTSASGLQTLTQLATTPAVRTISRMLIGGNFALNPAGSEVRLTVARLNTGFGGAAGLVKVILERTA